jgi:hypothetical protein
MIVSELIQKLQKCMKEVGDRKVIIMIEKDIGDTMMIINLWEESFEVTNSRHLDMRDNQIFLTVCNKEIIK